MTFEIADYHHELFQSIHAHADAEGSFVEDIFFDVCTESLIASGEVETADRAYYVGSRGIRVDGYGGDPANSDSVLHLIVADFSQSSEIETLTATNMDAIFNRLSNFMARSLDDAFRNGLEESGPAFGLADLIASRWPSLSKVRFFLITNRVLSSRVDGREAGEFKGIPITYSVWDLGRFFRFETSGQEREDFAVDLEEFGGPLLALPAHMQQTDYESYLAVVPGLQLARIYDRWGARLLEHNVRVFLQARGNVNRGIRDTIRDQPEMFFAYNNGITATAERIEAKKDVDGLLLTGMHNFQIVNGGQTTASIHAALRDQDVDLDQVFVQMKLSIVDSDKAIEVVPRISEYANTQNRVNAADFFSNHPFHVRMEEFSRRLYVPSRDGSFRESKWFYERARGQYLDARGHLSQAERRKFDLEYPKGQKFTKTDLAKFLNVWRERPEVVSRGAQKNFADFASYIGAEWNKREDHFNAMFYREVVAKAIIFKGVERLVSEQSWYEGGYRANVVAYSIAKLGHDVAQRGRSIDFEGIWRIQEIPDSIREALAAITKAVHDVIVDPPSNMRNVTEWAKQQACWNRVKMLKINFPKRLEEQLIDVAELKDERKEAAKEQKELNGIEAQTAVVQAGPEFWGAIKAWGDERKLLTPREQGILRVANSMPSKVPTERQSIRSLEILKRLRARGCQVGSDVL
ncbi:MAG: AIPR family protein [bacterium]|nr:AIPR family protein [bacterium]